MYYKKKKYIKRHNNKNNDTNIIAYLCVYVLREQCIDFRTSVLDWRTEDEQQKERKQKYKEIAS